MYLCICNQISEKEVKDLVSKNPNASNQEIIRKLGLGNDCGTCLQNSIDSFRDFQVRGHQQVKINSNTK